MCKFEHQIAGIEVHPLVAMAPTSKLHREIQIQIQVLQAYIIGGVLSDVLISAA